MPIGAVLALVFGLALWGEGVQKADGNWYERNPLSYSACRPYCYYKFFEHLEPWPLREHATYECPTEGAVDKCTGEKFNGKWWYKPEVK